jgi:hypothetical protein
VRAVSTRFKNPKSFKDEICDRISRGETLRSICRIEGFPAWQTVYDWIRDDEEFAKRIASARETGYDAIAEETVDILDTPPERILTEQGDRVDPGYVQWQKNRAEQRLKLLAKWSPKKYGDKIGVEHSGTVELASALEAARKRVQGDE